MRKLMIVVGARPNFIKITRFKQVAAVRGGIDVRIVHTGQHFSANMSDVFFGQFDLVPDHSLGIGAGSPNTQMAAVMRELEPVILAEAPDMVMVVGDVNSTLAAAITANRMKVPLAHLESGLRSFDRDMPEEHNRVLVDHISDHFFVTEQSGLDNLAKEGLDQGNVHFTGNTMIDTLVAYDERIQADPVLDRMGLGTGGHVLMTMHRPATVDHREGLLELVRMVTLVAQRHRVVFPLHPRAAANLGKFGLMETLRTLAGVELCGPLGYLAFQKLLMTSAAVVTDSGGVQEETTYRRIPCLTLRSCSERPITITEGSNELAPLHAEHIASALARVAAGSWDRGRVPALWDGHATERVFDVLERVL